MGWSTQNYTECGESGALIQGQRNRPLYFRSLCLVIFCFSVLFCSRYLISTSRSVECHSELLGCNWSYKHSSGETLWSKVTPNGAPDTEMRCGSRPEEFDTCSWRSSQRSTMGWLALRDERAPSRWNWLAHAVVSRGRLRYPAGPLTCRNTHTHNNEFLSTVNPLTYL